MVDTLTSEYLESARNKIWRLEWSGQNVIEEWLWYVAAVDDRFRYYQTKRWSWFGVNYNSPLGLNKPVEEEDAGEGVQWVLLQPPPIINNLYANWTPTSTSAIYSGLRSSKFTKQLARICVPTAAHPIAPYPYNSVFRTHLLLHLYCTSGRLSSLLHSQLLLASVT